MENLVPSISNFLAALICVALGIIVLARNHRKATHRAFAVLAFTLSLWALTVGGVIQSRSETTMRFWLLATEMIACFIPAVFYHFVGFFPKGTFDGNRTFLKILYASIVVLLPLTLTPWYIERITPMPDGPPEVLRGPAYVPIAIAMLTTAIAIFINLGQKLRKAKGIERRQLQHVCLGIVGIAALGLTANVLGPFFEVMSLQAYAPAASTALMMGFFAYAMIRYHLLDTRVLLSRVLVLSVLVGFIIVSSVTVVRWTVQDALDITQIVPIILAVLLVAVLLQAVEERIQAIIDRTILKRRYDINKVFTRITQNAAEVLQLDQLLRNVAEDIQNTVGISTIRVLLVDERNPNLLITEYSSNPEERYTTSSNHAQLIHYLRTNSDPIILEKILHRRPTEEMATVAKHLAALDAYFCLPLKNSTGLVGIMTLGQKNNHDIYSADELVAFRALAGPLGTAIANARLYKELESVNLHLARVLGQMREGVIAVDDDGVVTTVNDAAKKLLGPVVVGAALSSLTREIASLLHTTLDEQRPISDFETTIESPKGEPVSVIVSSSCLHTPQRTKAGAVALIYDLSQVKRLEQNVLRADRLSSLGTLAAGMAHEIKNPLVSIKTFSQLLLERYEDPDYRATFEDVVPQEVDRIDTIVSRLLDFARPRPVRFEPRLLNTIVNDVLTLVENQTRKGLITVDCEFGREDLTIFGDEQQLHQVFLNLILNAIDAMKETEGGHLSIRAHSEHVHLRRGDRPAGVDTECAVIDITDTGCGIATENIENLFTPFFTTKSEGCGLGLAVVHGIISEHGGDIDVSSVQGRGTTFTVTLPLAHSATAAKAGGGV